MSQKNATPTQEQKLNICKAGLKPDDWTVVKDLLYSMIIRNRHTNEYRMIGK